MCPCIGPFKRSIRPVVRRTGLQIRTAVLRIITTGHHTYVTFDLLQTLAIHISALVAPTRILVPFLYH